jgi:uncharacterized protein (DUF2267 family)
MSATGLDVFDKTLQTTNIWLNEIKEKLGGADEQLAWKVLSVVLQKLRDRLPADLSAHLGAELPLLIRGAYYDQYEPSKQPTRYDRDEFIGKVRDWLSDARPVDAKDAVSAVFSVLSAHVPHGQIDNVQNALPKELRQFWILAEEDVVRPSGQGEARPH